MVLTGSNVESSPGNGTVLVVFLQLPWDDINAHMGLCSLYV